MKTKTFIMVCLLSFFGLTHLAAQNSNSDGTYNIQVWWEATYWSPVYCGDNMVDFLEGGELIIHTVVHRKDGNRIWRIDHMAGEVTSSRFPYEVFTIRELDKFDFVENVMTIVTWKYNLFGNMGSHYIGVLTQNVSTGEITVGMTVCN